MTTYAQQYLQHHGKLHMCWLGPFCMVYISEASVAKLDTLQGQWIRLLINGSRLKLYYGPQGSPII
jgi:hypothetical protein